MRKIYTILAALFMSSALFSQVPQKMSYQAIIRDAAGNLVANQGIGMRLTVLDALNPVFVETHSATTDVNGLVTVTVGAGTPVTGTLATINWGAGVFTIKTETDISALGGTTYTVIGTSDVMSIPYALYVKTAADATFSGDYNDLINKPVMDGSETKVNAGTRMTVTGTGTSGNPYVISATPLVGGFTHYLGEDVGDGIVFYIYTGSDGKERVLIANYNESAQLLQNPVTNTGGIRSYDGQYNTQLYPNSAARTYVESLGSDWYIPSIDELTYMWQNRFHLNYGLAAHGAGATLLTVDARYWSSTEFITSTDRAYNFNFLNGNTENSFSKANPGGYLIRAVRSLTPLASVTTDTPTPINSTSCTSGGNVTGDGGSPVTDRGVCWNALGAPSLLNSATHDGTGTGAFTSTITGLTLGQVYYIRAYATNSEGTRYGDEETYTSLSIGDAYQGGYVAYIYQSGDPGYIAGQVHGIIVFPTDLADSKWGCQGTPTGDMLTGIGTGQANTLGIVNDCSTAGIAARICNDKLDWPGDWYLPSKDDLNKLYQARALITGGFASAIYWSSSETGNSTAWTQHLGTGVQANNLTKGTNYKVRPIRYF
jgi:hypothetical protein